MKIMGWNINGMRSTFAAGKGAVGKINLESFLISNDCDIYCFQETKTSDWSKLTKDLVTIKGFDCFWDFSKKKKGYSGTVTFAKKGITKTSKTGFGHSDFDDEGRCIMTDHGHFVLFNVYFPNGGMGEERLLYKYEYYDAFYQEIHKLIQNNRNIIITGDVNTAHKDIDVWNPTLFATMTGFLPREREWIDRMIEIGFVDAFRKINPGKKESFTFWDTRTNKRPANNGWRIDYFLVSSSLENQIMDSQILANVIPRYTHLKVHGSDHCPITLTLDHKLEHGYPTPKNAGNLRSEFRQVSQVDIKSFFTQRPLKRPLEDVEDISLKKT